MTIVSIKKSTVGIVLGAALAVLGNGVANAAPTTPGYLTDSSGKIWKNSYKECWRSGMWTPAMAIAECDPDLVKKEEPKKVAEAEPMPVPAPAPMVGPEKPAFDKITLQAETLFDFDKAIIHPEGKQHLNAEVVAKMKQYPQVEAILVTGHADRIGTDSYNQNLSERRAEAVKNYLVSEGIESNRIQTAAKGESEPVVACDDVKGKENGSNKKLITCLQPNRRVVVEVEVQRPTQP